MNLKIGTLKLQSMLTKASRGSLMNKMMPITNLLSISVKDKEIVLTTTDVTNYLYIKDTVDFEGEFNVVVTADIFYKLIARMTCDFVELSVEDDILTVIGNGEYKIELPLNEEGNLIVYPNPAKTVTWDYEWNYEAVVSRESIRLLLDTAKASLSVTSDAVCYTGYYIADKAVTTDTQVLCGIKSQLLGGRPVLLYASTVDLLDIMTDATITYRVNSNADVLFTSSNCDVYGHFMDSIDDFQIDVISDLLDQEFDSSCSIHKLAFLQALDRVSLFVGPYDKNCVYLTFTENGILIQSRQTDSSEVLKYASVDNFKSFTCCIDVEMLKTQIKAYKNDMINLQYGRENAIKLVDGIVTQVICLQEDI